MRDHSSSSYLPITEKQKRILVAVYQRTGNMAGAMREAGIGSSRTAYRWWHRFVEEGEEGLSARSHARKTQRTIAEEIAGCVRELRRVHPDWGRRRIAEMVASLYGKHVISPAGVEAVLRREQLWHTAFEAPDNATDLPVSAMNWFQHGRINEEALVALIQQGLTMRQSDHAEGARRLYQQHLWTPQQDQRMLWAFMRQSPEVGQWLLRSRIVLAHSLMNTGRWEQATVVLMETLTWMQEQDSWLRHQSWEEEDGFNVRPADAWVESLQYLGIVLQETDYERAQAYLSTALIGLERPWRTVVPKYPSAMRSNVKRDIASLKVKSGRLLGREIEYELEDSVSGLDPVHLVPGKMAGIGILWAKVSAGRARAVGAESHLMRLRKLERMEQAVEQTLALVQQDPSPMLQANFIADAAQIYQEQGMQLDAQLLRNAVHFCLDYGYRREAGQLLQIQTIGQLLTEADLHRLIRLAGHL